MVRHLIVLTTAAIAMATFSAHRAEASGMTQIQAITACRAELGKHAKYMDVRKCVVEKMKAQG